MIVVHDFPGGARGLRVAWLCEEMGLACAIAPVGFPPDDAYRTLNPIGTVPFLQDGDAEMSESIAMLLYVAQKYGPTDALPPVADARYARVLQFTVLGEASLSSPMAPLLAERYGAPTDQKRNWSVVGIENRLKRTVEHLGHELGDREFFAGRSLTLADISIETALRIWTRGLGHELPPSLRDYCARLEARPACQRALAAHKRN